MTRIFEIICIISLLSMAATAQNRNNNLSIVFMEPDESAESDSLPAYRLVADQAAIAKYSGWLKNEPAQIAIDLFNLAWQKSKNAGSPPVYHIALVNGGNHADLGFKLNTANRTEDHSKTPYIKLGPEEWVFSTTFLHETGHVILSLLNNGDGVPSGDLSSIPHSTAALSDRATAFNEGFSIHLETLAAHLTDDPTVHQRYHHPNFAFGADAGMRSEYFRTSADVLTYSQTRTRYYEVRENCFAFAPAFDEPDYLRVQLDKSRDFSSLRDANQLLQSEGFYATFFFAMLFAGKEAPSREIIRQRQGEMLDALKEMFVTHPSTEDTPYLLNFVKAYSDKFPDKKNEMVDLVLDLTHGVVVDENAAQLWRDHYNGVIRLDLAERKNEKIMMARKKWHDEAIANLNVLYRRIGPQIRCQIDSVSILLVAFGEAAPLIFDVNTVETGIIKLVPGISPSEVSKWIAERAKSPYRDITDFKQRSGLSQAMIAQMKLGATQEMN